MARLKENVAASIMAPRAPGKARPSELRENLSHDDVIIRYQESIIANHPANMARLQKELEKVQEAIVQQVEAYTQAPAKIAAVQARKTGTRQKLKEVVHQPKIDRALKLRAQIAKDQAELAGLGNMGDGGEFNEAELDGQP